MCRLVLSSYASTAIEQKWGYVLARAAWGNGYMTEAPQTLVRIVFDELPVSRVWASCDLVNGASMRVLDEAGLLREGVLRRYGVHPNLSEEPRDVYVYARTRPLGASMNSHDVSTVLAAFAERNVPARVGGGWGIDALLVSRRVSTRALTSPSEPSGSQR
jgi:Acetyltransferase (GNAT) domain